MRKSIAIEYLQYSIAQLPWFDYVSNLVQTPDITKFESFRTHQVCPPKTNFEPTLTSPKKQPELRSKIRKGQK